MNWIFTIALFIAGCVTKDTDILLAAGIFGIGGSIESLAAGIKNSHKN